MSLLKEDQIYAIDGGLFRAVYDEQQDRLQLWTYQGHSGRMIARTGFEVDIDGRLYHRIFDFETREQLLIASKEYTVEDLDTVDEAEFS